MSDVERLYVFDACAVLALLNVEQGAEVVAEILADPENRCLLCSINACEVFYDVFRGSGEADAMALERTLETNGLEIREAMPAELWKTAGRFKATLRRVSLADCFALALAVLEGATLVTSDHHEFDRIAELGICPILFIR